MHVLHVAKDVYPPVADGIARHIDQVRRSLPNVRSDVLVGARARGTERHDTAGGIGSQGLRAGPRAFGAAGPDLPIWQRRMKSDVVHLHMPNPTGELSTLVATPRRTPVVVTYHADIVRQAWLTPVYRPLVNACLERARVDHRQQLTDLSGLAISEATRPKGDRDSVWSGSRSLRSAAGFAGLRDKRYESATAHRWWLPWEDSSTTRASSTWWRRLGACRPAW